jgi:hypothetical protein
MANPVVKIVGKIAKEVMKKNAKPSAKKTVKQAVKTAKKSKPIANPKSAVKVLQRSGGIENRGTKVTGSQNLKRAKEYIGQKKFDRAESNYELAQERAYTDPASNVKLRGVSSKKIVRENRIMRKATPKAPIKINSAPKKKSK